MEVYVDHAATTPLDPRCLEAMLPFYREDFYNPSSLYRGGQLVRGKMEENRRFLAEVWGCSPEELFFTSGGTEGDNLAVLGAFRARKGRHLIVSAIEHHAVLEAAAQLEQEGARVTYLPCGPDGRIHPDTLRAAMTPETDLVSVMWANNEVGTVQPVTEIAAVAAEFGIPFHTDAVQAFGTLPVSFKESGATTMAISAHKIGGPMGIGALIATRSAQLMPVLHGGGQERSVRSGTIDAASIAGFGAAAAEAGQNLLAEAGRQAELRDRLIEGVLAAVPEAQLRGAAPESAQDRAAGSFSRLPGNAHFTFPGCEGDSLLFLLDMAGVESSTGSACNAGVPRPSHVLLAMGLSEDEARGAQRFTLGHTSTEDDVTALLTALPGAWAQAKKAGMAGHAPDAARWN